ncbi:MAG: FecR family protein [Myxococcota bacterium]
MNTMLIMAALAANGFAAEAIAVRGQVEVIAAGTDDVAPVLRGSKIRVGDSIVTGTASAVRLLMDDKSVIDLASDTSFLIQDYSIDRTARRRKGSVKLSLGRMWARVSGWFGGSNSYEVNSPNAVAGVRGTEFIFAIGKDGQAELNVKSGSVELSNATKEKVLAELGALSQAVGPIEGEVTVREISEKEWIELTRPFDLGFGISEEELAKLNSRETSREDDAAPAGFGTFLRPSETPVGPVLPLEPGVGFGPTDSTVTTEVRDD